MATVPTPPPGPNPGPGDPALLAGIVALIEGIRRLNDTLSTPTNKPPDGSKGKSFGAGVIATAASIAGSFAASVGGLSAIITASGIPAVQRIGGLLKSFFDTVQTKGMTAVNGLTGAFSAVGAQAGIVAGLVGKFNPAMAERFTRVMDDLQAVLGSILQGPLEGVIRVIRGFADSLLNLGPAGAQMVQALALAGTAFAGVAAGVALVTTLLSPLGLVLGVAGGAMAAMMSDSKASAAVLGVVSSAFGEFDRAAKVVAPVIQSIASGLAASLGKVLPPLIGLGAALFGAFAQGVSALVPLLTPVVDVIAGMVPAFAALATALGDAVGGTLAPVVADLVRTLSGQLAPVIAQVAATVAGAAPLIAKAVQMYADVIADAGPSIVAFMTSLAQLFADLLVPLVDLAGASMPAFNAVLKNTWSLIKWVADAMRVLIGWLRDLLDVVGLLGNAAAKAGNDAKAANPEAKKKALSEQIGDAQRKVKAAEERLEDAKASVASSPPLAADEKAKIDAAEAKVKDATIERDAAFGGIRVLREQQLNAAREDLDAAKGGPAVRRANAVTDAQAGLNTAKASLDGLKKQADDPANQKKDSTDYAARSVQRLQVIDISRKLREEAFRSSFGQKGDSPTDLQKQRISDAKEQTNILERKLDQVVKAVDELTATTEQTARTYRTS